MNDIESERPDYGYVAWRYFAIMGTIGTIGLISYFTLPIVLPDFTFIIQVISFCIAIIGLWIGGSYLLLYPTMFAIRPNQDYLGDAMSVTGSRGDERILDVGCGTGRVSIQMAKRFSQGTVVGVDIFEGVSGNSPVYAERNATIEGVSDRVTFQHGNLTELPFSNESFDIVTLGSVLHELHEESIKRKALSEIWRVLKPEGRLIVFELHRSFRMFLVMLFFAFVWSPREYWLKLLENDGFQLIYEIEYKSILKSGVYVCQKKPKESKENPE